MQQDVCYITIFFVVLHIPTSQMPLTCWLITFWASSTDLKRNSNSRHFILWLRRRKTLNLFVKRQSSNFSPKMSCSSKGCFRSGIQEAMEGFECRINGRALGVALQHIVRRASTKSGRFRVGRTRCWQRPSRFRKKCRHSCDTDYVRVLNFEIHNVLHLNLSFEV